MSDGTWSSGLRGDESEAPADWVKAFDRLIAAARTRAGLFLLGVNYTCVCVAGAIAAVGGQSVVIALLMSGCAAVTATLAMAVFRAQPAGRMVIAVCLAIQVMAIIFAASGLSPAFVEEAHMSFFVINAFLVSFLCIRSLLLYNGAVVLHHLVLTFALPRAVWTDGGAQDGAIHLMVHAGIALILVGPMIFTVHQVRRYMERDARALALATIATRRAEAEARDATEARASNRAKSQFLASISHEIRTPLNGVLGMAQAMSFTNLSVKQRGQLETISHSGAQLLAIVNDFLDFSKIEAGKVLMEEIEFDLDVLLQSAEAIFTSTAQEKGIQLHVDIAPEAQGLYRGDPTRVGQIVHNLLSNAIKFTAAGQVEVLATHSEQGLCIAVRDTGIGIAPEALDYVFDLFTQADATTTRQFGGTGLGLSICRSLAENMGGGIDVASRVGAGSTFRFFAPLFRVAGTAALAEPISGETDFASMGLRVLAADDNATNRLVLQALLQSQGIDPVVVDDGLQVMEAWRAGSWDIILMDIQMPNLDGVEATQLIREEETLKGLGRTPIIALTANAMTHQTDVYLAAGIDGVVAKPIIAADLFQAIVAVFEPQNEQGAADGGVVLVNAG